MRSRVVVIGGGLTGLACAWHLRDVAEVVVLEGSDRAGGQIRTVDLGGVAMDVGADAFLARQPEGEALVREAGLGGELVAPSARQVLLWVHDRLRPLPDGTVFGAPADLLALARSRVLSPSGLVRAAVEPLLPRRSVVGDRSVADLVGERFGREVVGALVEPLLGGVYAGRAEELSAASTMPPLWRAAQDHRSLRAGLRAHRQGNVTDDRPVFLTLRGGLTQLVERLEVDLGDRLRTGMPAVGLRRDDGSWQVKSPAGEFTADHLVVAAPAAAAAALLRGVVPEAARDLAAIRTASVGVIALAYRRRDTVAVPDASGVLVPRRSGRLVKAVTISSRKWAHHADAERFLLRASVGRVGESDALDLDDDVLADRVDAEVRWALGIRAPAAERLVVRWPDALPQYDVGHAQRVERIRHALRAVPGLHVAGAGLDGVGLTARAREAALLSARISGSRTTGETTAGTRAPFGTDAGGAAEVDRG